MIPPPTQARDEMLDEAGRLRGPWRQMLGTLLGLGQTTLRERADDLDRAYAAERVSLGSSGESWRCDPIPLLFTESEFDVLSAGLVQRARLLEAVLRDVYGPRSLLAEGLLPAALVAGNPRYLRPCHRTEGDGQMMQLYAADLQRLPDGRWAVVADYTGEPAGLAYALENRRRMARVLPELFRPLEVSPLRPFFDIWQDALQRLVPAHVGNPGLALLTPGHADPMWFEHVMLARELSCALVESADLTIRDGSLFLKTLRGLQPVHVLLRRLDGAGIDPLELVPGARGGIPGLLNAVRAGTVRVVNDAACGFAESPGLAAFLPALCGHLLEETPLLGSPRTLWLGEAAAREAVLGDLRPWQMRSAVDSRAPVAIGADLTPARAADLAEHIRAKPWAYVAIEDHKPSFAPCVGGDLLEPRGVVLRLFLVFDDHRWRVLQGGIARVLPKESGHGVLPISLGGDVVSKDVWVLLEEGGDIVGPDNIAVANLPIRRTAGDMPSRVADNFYWLGRYLERLENAARLLRALVARLSRASLLPRELPEVTMLLACLVEAGVVSQEMSAYAGPTVTTELLLRAATAERGGVARLIGRVSSLADLLRDRLTDDMHSTVMHGLRELADARSDLLPIRPAQGLERLGGLASQALALGATIAGFAAENMVRGGGRLFLELGRRIERAQSVAWQLRNALDQKEALFQPGRIEAGLHLALELFDSVITYRARYLTVVQPAPVLDLVMADEGNPRGLIYQLLSARAVLTSFAEDDGGLAGWLDGPIADIRAMISELADADDQYKFVITLPPRLHAIEAQAAALSNVITRQYFSLLPVNWTLGTDTAPGAA